MPFHNKQSMRDYNERCSRRGSERGRLFEKEVLQTLNRMVSEEKLCKAVFHNPNSAEDCDGMDFTVSKVVDGAAVKRSFGVTRSHKSWRLATVRHPKTPQFCFPIGTNPMTIEKRVLDLFSQ